MYLSSYIGAQKVRRSFSNFIICILAFSFILMFPGLNKGYAKIFGSILIILSEVYAVIIAYNMSKSNMFDIHKKPWKILVSLLSFNALYILLGFFDNDCVITTYCGNIDFQPAFLLPIFALIGCEYSLFSKIFKGAFYYSILFAPLFLFLGHVTFFFGIMFYIILSYLKYLSKRRKIIVLLSVIFFTYVSFLEDARTPIIRILIASGVLIFSYFHKYISRRLRLIIMGVVVVLPLYFFALYCTTGHSVFQEDLSNIEYLAGSGHGTDTRTFLYQEVLSDLNHNNSLVFGKGINGKYYSSYFSMNAGDSDSRNNPEVGILSMLLKGGVVYLVLNLLLLLIAIWQSFVKSENLPAQMAGMILLGHFFLLFFEDIPQYSLYCISIWFMLGMCLSKRFIKVTEKEFYFVLRYAFKQ